jgi:predicted anti-sigma-YlaC factor YlaD
MSLKHLTDEEIQEYLDGNLSPENELLFETHLKICPHCQESLKQYQSLYVDLANDEGFDLPKSFAESVLSRLPAEPEAKSHFKYASIFWTILGIITIGITFYYVDLKPLGRVISNIFVPQYEFGSELIVSIKNSLVSLNGNLSLLAFAGLTLLIIAALDRALVQPRYRRI